MSGADASSRPVRPGERREVVFVGAAERPVTGGERYGREVIDALSRSGPVETIGFADLPPSARGYLASNRWLLRRYGERLGRLILVEDQFWHPRTFAFNWLARMRGARIVVIVHHLYHRLRPRRWERWIDRWLELVALAASHRIIVNSRATADEVAALGIPRRRMIVLPPGVDRVPEPIERHAGAVVRLLAVGAVTPRKGLDVLIAALNDAPFEFRLEIVGDVGYDQSYRKELEETVSRFALAERISFLGRISAAELDDAYRRADVFVAPSRWEGFGIALLDALLHGLPVVATRVGAIPELVRDGENGLLVPPDDVEALRDALRRLADDDALRLRMGERGREFGLRAARGWDRVAADAAAVVLELA